jgi:hypothetical protein
MKPWPPPAAGKVQMPGRQVSDYHHFMLFLNFAFDSPPFSFLKT